MEKMGYCFLGHYQNIYQFIQELKIRFLMLHEAISILKIKSFSSFDMRVKIYAAIASLFSSSHNNYRLAFIVRSFVKQNT